MNDSAWIFALATLLGALGLWLMLPRGNRRGWTTGVVLVAAALGLWASRLPRLGDWTEDSVFLILAGTTVVAAIAAITMRDPVHCAIWFSMSLLGTAGLFLFTGAQFLAVAIVGVYAGAILVTFLFVLMLAQPEGRASYDRLSSEALVSAATGIVMVGMLSITVASVLSPTAQKRDLVAAASLSAGNREDSVLGPQHVAQVGAELFGRHLIAVEVAGTLLMATLVGAAVILAQAKTEQRE
jgi:NADH-quinone oxidoreductase subunit J